MDEECRKNLKIAIDNLESIRKIAKEHEDDGTVITIEGSNIKSLAACLDYAVESMKIIYNAKGWNDNVKQFKKQSQ